MRSEGLLLVAGEDLVPELVYREAKKRFARVKVYGYSFLKYRSSFSPDFLDDCFSLQNILDYLNSNALNYLCFAGKVPRGFLFCEKLIGEDLKPLLSELLVKGDREVLETVFGFLQKRNCSLLSPVEFLSDNLTPAGFLTCKKPSSHHWSDIKKGMQIASFLADWEVGQTVVLKEGAVLAVEAAEGTTETIRRGISFGKGEVVVVKMARSKQDFFVDVPAIGEETIRALGKQGGIIALEAQKTMIINLPEVISLANSLDIGIVGISRDGSFSFS
ncbi:MAG: UDP-2,3-diacylglucosamine diphosphatase LpxI [Candidatus Atribacteria bacterium]|nr:UDP-2,3-diacylglucosamine diphosphatase LpxI [Candidatus Atribacteria bacterium]MCD6350347.1 UDP-2,3-diacylglucosamine diphosphatase LpxI [Candidatus Atribacteria bacterium]